MGPATTRSLFYSTTVLSIIIVGANPIKIVPLINEHIKTVRDSSWPAYNIDKFGSYAENLDTVLSPLKDCLIVLDNCRNVDILPGNVPFLIRYYMPAAFYYKKGWNWWERVQNIWTRIGSRSLELSPTQTVLRCNNSNYFVAISEYNELMDDILPHSCVKFNYFKYASATKPWNCMAQVSLYFPSKYAKETYGPTFPTVFHYPIGYIQNAPFRPNLTPNLNVLIDFADSVETYKQYFLQYWMKETFHLSGLWKKRSRPTFSLDLFFIALTTRRSNRNLYYRIRTIIAFKLCNRCLEHQHQYQISTWSNLNLASIINLSIPGLDDDQLWSGAETITPGQDHALKLYKHLMSYPNKYTTATSSIAETTSRIPSYEDRINHAYASVIQSIMTNYSVDSFDKCKHPGDRRGLIVDSPVYPCVTKWALDEQGGFFSHPRNLMTMEKSLNNLQFVSCGNRGVSRFPFDQLISVYDGFIWLGIGISAVVVSVTLTIAQGGNMKKCALYLNPKHIMSLVRLLIEQGDPFPTKLTNIGRARPLLAAVLLVGIVISNAYKNANVYNMISHRSRLKFEYLNDLVDHNFTFFVRAISVTFIGFQSAVENIDGLYFELDHYGLFMKNRKQNSAYGFMILSEFKEAAPFMTFNSYQKFLKIEPKLRFPPNASDLAYDAIELLSKKQKEDPITFQNIREKEQEFKGTFVESQQRSLLKELSRCKNAAVILPKVLCAKFAQKLLRMGLTDVDIGQEEYTNSKLGVDVEGPTTVAFLARLVRMQESGIPNWWNNYFANAERLRDQSSNVPKAPNMSGNILVIFVTFAVGIVGAVAIFFFEQWRVFTKAIRWCHHRSSLYLWAAGYMFCLLSNSISSHKTFTGGTRIITVKSARFN